MNCEEKQQVNISQQLTTTNETTTGYVVMDMTKNQQAVLQHKIDETCENVDNNCGDKKCNDEYIHILPIPQHRNLTQECNDLMKSTFRLFLFCTIISVFSK